MPSLSVTGDRDHDPTMLLQITLANDIRIDEKNKRSGTYLSAMFKKPKNYSIVFYWYFYIV